MYTYILNKGQNDTYIKDDLDTQKEKQKTKNSPQQKKR
jgi:hypothetical protein